MSRVKQGLGVLAIFGLLVTVAAAPILVMMYKNNRMFGRINVTSLPVVEGDGEKTQQSSDIRERLCIIREAPNVIVQQADAVSDEKKRDIVSIMEEELEKLTGLGIIPQLVFPDVYQASVSKITYIKSQNPKEAVSLWEMHVRYEGLDIIAYMDTDVFLLYGFDIIFEGENSLYSVMELPEEEFLQYLQLGLESVDEEGERFSVAAYYSESIISVFAATYDEKEQKVHSFEFGSQGTVGYNRVEEYNLATE